MSSTVLIAGVGIVGFLLAYLFFKLDDNKHQFLRLLLLGCLFGVFILAGKIGLDSNTVCDLTLSNTTEYNSTVYFNYETICYDVSDSNTSVVFYKLNMWIIRIISAYLLVFLIYQVLVWSREYISGKRGRAKNGE